MVAELIAAGDFLAMNGTDGMVRRWERAKAALSAEPAAQGEAVAEWQRKCPDYPNCPNLGCPCAPATKEKEQGAAELVDVARHNRLVVGLLPHTHVRLQQKAYDAARAAFGTTTEADDRAVYWAVQAYLHASDPPAPPAQPAERVPEGWREAFEDCYMRANEVGILHRDDDGEYTSAFTKVAWALWNERACLSPIYWWHASRDDDALTWTVHSPSGDSCEVHERAAGAHAEILRQLAQDLTASPAPSDGGKGVEG